MRGFQGMWDNVKRGENIELYITVFVSFVLVAIDLVWVNKLEWIDTIIDPLTLAVLSLFAISMLRNLQKVKDDIPASIKNISLEAVISQMHSIVNQALAETLQEMQKGLSVSVYPTTQGIDGDKFLYDSLIEFISTAEDSIRIVHRFTPSPHLEVTPARKMYYQALNSILDKKHQMGDKLRYQRILQVDKVKPGRLDSNQIDPILHEHCTKLAELQNLSSSLKIHLRQIPNILGSFGFVIVDDYKIFFLIPTITRSASYKLRAVQVGAGMSIIDLDGVFIGQLVNLFYDLLLGADEILMINDSGEDDNEQGVSGIGINSLDDEILMINDRNEDDNKQKTGQRVIKRDPAGHISAEWSN